MEALAQILRELREASIEQHATSNSTVGDEEHRVLHLRDALKAGGWLEFVESMLRSASLLHLQTQLVTHDIVIARLVMMKDCWCRKYSLSCSSVLVPWLAFL